MTHHDKARELVQRLLRQKTTDEMERYEVINADFEGAYDLLVRDCQEAADLITALAEENRRLREALQPFAEVAEHDIGEDEADCDAFRPMFGVNRAPYLTVGDLRRARTALSSGEGE